MNKGVRAYQKAIVETLTEFGITEYRFDNTGKHMRCVFNLPNGKERFSVFPKSPSDAHRGALNQQQDVRRIIRAAGFERIGPKA